MKTENVFEKHAVLVSGNMLHFSLTLTILYCPSFGGGGGAIRNLSYRQ
jgi:hypothetical protein